MESGPLRVRRLMLVLGDPSRWSIARELEDGGRCVTDLARAVGLSQSCTTRHLQALERERIVESARAGKRVIYALRTGDAQVAGLLALVLRSEPAARSRTDEAPRRRSRPAEVSPAPAPPAPTPEPIPQTSPAVRRSEIEDYLL